MLHEPHARLRGAAARSHCCGCPSRAPQHADAPSALGSKERARAHTTAGPRPCPTAATPLQHCDAPPERRRFLHARLHSARARRRQHRARPLHQRRHRARPPASGDGTGRRGAPGGPGGGQVVREPAQQQLLRRRVQQRVHVLAWPPQRGQRRARAHAHALRPPRASAAATARQAGARARGAEAAALPRTHTHTVPTSLPSHAYVQRVLCRATFRRTTANALRRTSRARSPSSSPTR